MSEAEILVSDVYLRGMWMLDQQMMTVKDLVTFWKLFGPTVEKVPALELHPAWDVV